MAGVKPQGGHGRVSCVVLSAVALQLMSSLLNFGGLSNFVRDFAWGLLLLTFLAVGRYDVVGFLSPEKPRKNASLPIPQAPK